MKMKIRLKSVLLLSAFMLIILYLFWGPLFPWNPVKIGYEKIRSGKAIIYITSPTEGDSIVYKIDEIIQEEEKFHDLNYTDDFKVVIVNKSSSMKRYLPWLKGSGYSVSFSPANLIYIGPAARKSTYGIEPYLKHELSHLLIDQNTTFKKALKIHEQGWFAEGIAEYFSGHSFYTKNEFLKLCETSGFRFTSLHEKNPLKMSLREIRLKYTYYRFFIEYLIENYGIEKLHQYLKKYIHDPAGYKNLFPEIYSADLDAILNKFNSSLRS